MEIALACAEVLLDDEDVTCADICVVVRPACDGMPGQGYRLMDERRDVVDERLWTALDDAERTHADRDANKRYEHTVVQ